MKFLPLLLGVAPIVTVELFLAFGLHWQCGTSYGKPVQVSAHQAGCGDLIFPLSPER